MKKAPLSLTAADCAMFISRCSCMTAFSGAGISTAAGIPDFRGPRGLYVTRRYDPEKVFDIRWFRRDHGYFYEFAHDFVTLMQTVRPTFTHYFLAQLEGAGKLRGVVTQNIDMLHQTAGSRHVVELHGSFGSATCSGCRRVFSQLTANWWAEEMRVGTPSTGVLCPVCRGVLKPDIVFFGESVQGFDEAERMICESDLLLVLGSSLTVTPASHLPRGARGLTVVVNRGEVALEPSPRRFFVNEEADVFFREVAALLGMDTVARESG